MQRHDRNGARGRERGSVLIMVIGLLVILTLLATSLITAVGIHRDAARNQNLGEICRFAALSGKAHAIDVLKTNAAANTNLSGGSGDMWVSVFRDSDAGAFEKAEDVWDLWKFAGAERRGASPHYYYDPYPDDGNHDGKSRTFITALYGDEQCRKSASIWRGNSKYRKGDVVLKDASGLGDVGPTALIYKCIEAGTSGAGQPSWPPLWGTVSDGSVTWQAVTPGAQAQYAVSIIDLDGRLPLNKDTPPSATYGSNDDIGAILDQVEAGDASYTVNGAGVQAVYAAGNKCFSWEQLRFVGDKTMADKTLLLLTPFGGAKGDTLGTVGGSFNINTAPKKMLAGIYEVTKGNLGTTYAGGVTTTGVTWAGNVLTNRPYASLPSTGDTVELSIFGAASGAAAATVNDRAAVRAWVGSSRFFRVVVRGRIYSPTLGEVIAKADLEFVYCVNGANGHVIFQRWLDQ